MSCCQPTDADAVMALGVDAHTLCDQAIDQDAVCGMAQCCAYVTVVFVIIADSMIVVVIIIVTIMFIMNVILLS